MATEHRQSKDQLSSTHSREKKGREWFGRRTNGEWDAQEELILKDVTISVTGGQFETALGV